MKCEQDCLCYPCWRKHADQGCSYGQPDGFDDYFKDCECEEE